MSKRTADLEVKDKKGLVNVVGWSLLVILILFSFKTHFEGLTKKHPHTFDEGQYVWLAHHLVESPGDYSTRGLFELETKTGRRFHPAVEDYLTKPLFKHPPLYVYLLKWSLPYSPFLVPALMGCVILLVGFLLSRTAYGTPAAILTVMFLTLDPNLRINSQKLWMETTLVAFTMLALLCFVKAVHASKEKETIWYLASGVSLGLAVNVKYSAFVFLIGFLLYVVLFNRNLLKIKGLWFIPIMTLLMVIPWLIKNLTVYGHDFSFFNHLNTLASSSNRQMSVIVMGGLVGLILLTFIFIGGLYQRRGSSKTDSPGVLSSGLRSHLRQGLPVFIGILFFAWLFTDAVFRQRFLNMLSPTSLPTSSFLTGFFKDESARFYFGRFLELSPFYFLSYLIFFIPFLFKSQLNHTDLILLTQIIVFSVFAVLWRSYQCRYALPITTPLLFLSSRVAVQTWWYFDGFSSKFLRLFLKSTGLLLMILAIAKTLWVDLKFVLPNDMAYY